MFLSHSKTFMTIFTMVEMVISLNWPAVVQAGGGSELCGLLPPPFLTCRIIDVEVEIVIKPGDPSPSINPRSHGKIPVAVLTTETFDATTVDPNTVCFGTCLFEGEATPVHWTLEDVNGDGDLDLLLHFPTQDTGIHCGDTTAELTGSTFGIPLLEEKRILFQLFTEIVTFRTVGCH